MSLATGVMVYFLSWWLIWFMLLPIGIVTQEESGEGVVPGTPKSAPIKAKRLLWKALAATILAGVVWGIAYYIITSD